jgi:hypothetical protein
VIIGALQQRAGELGVSSPARFMRPVRREYDSLP